MNSHNMNTSSHASRRKFMKRSGTALAGLALANAIGTRGFASEDNTIKFALVGCGSRGTGATFNALNTKGPIELWSMADVFDGRPEYSLKAVSKRVGKQVDVPKDRQFVGMDAYKKAIDAVAPGGLVLLATPPAFRPMHFEYAVAKGCNVFMEKSFAVDAPGIHRVLKAGEEAGKKNLKVAGGLMSRHHTPLVEAVEQIRKGIIGEVITAWGYRNAAPVGCKPKLPDESELSYQIRNYSNFTWLNGSYLLDWLIHNLDVCCWVKGDWPVSAQGQGGRQVRVAADQLYDHYGVEYTFPDGTRMFAQGRGMSSCWNFWGCVIHGAKGSAILGEGKDDPVIYKGHNTTRSNQIWKYEGPPCNKYQYEIDLLVDAIRQDKPYNETERCAKAAMTGILGRMAAESGKMITWDEAMSSTLQLAPGLDQFTMKSDPPVKPDTEGHYPIAMPGVTKVL